jgi:hypothetical protein
MRHPLSSAMTVASVSFLLACSTTSDVPDDTKTMTKQAGDGQSAFIGSAVVTPPTVKILDASHQPVAGTEVTFTVVDGGGSITGGSAVTDLNGVAMVGSWTLGATPGTNTLSAVAADIAGSPLSFEATANPRPPASIIRISGNNLTGPVGSAAIAPQIVRVLDAVGNPVAGVTVTFVVTSGGGSVINGSTAITGAAGSAYALSWTLGPVPGVNTLTATVDGEGITGNPVTFTATATASIRATKAVDKP